ncbi:MAG TPA: histidine kinase [Pyrinomonadaceae bacterium]|nr:histidine kinase [Pyrinomonadaceae bacterium]
MTSTPASLDYTPSASCLPTVSDDNPRHRPFLKRLARYGIIWGLWTIVALFFSTQIFMMYYAEGQPIPYKRAFIVQGSACYLWALVTPLVLWLARRFCIDRNQWIRKMALHFVFSLVLVTVLISLHFVVYMILAGMVSAITPLRLAGYLYPNLDRWLLVYWLILLMSHAFNYYNSYRKGELKASQLRTQLVQSQLEALKMQVQPHFLFNTLHSISALLSKDTEGARKMITRLGDFLRLTLENSGSMEVTLRQEIEFLNGYLEIERIRFQDRLTTDIQIDPSVLEARVPNLILQPIVENAMKHAVVNSRSGHVEISAAPRNGAVHIEVKDNGPGLAVDRTLEVRRGKGLGLANTQARLVGLYGTAARFEMTNRPSGGLVVSIEIPRYQNS